MRRRSVLLILIIALLASMLPLQPGPSAQAASTLEERFKAFMRDKSMDGSYTPEKFKQDNPELYREIKDYFQALGISESIHTRKAGTLPLNYPLAAKKEIVAYGKPFDATDKPGYREREDSRWRYWGYTQQGTAYFNHEFPPDVLTNRDIRNRNWHKRPWTRPEQLFFYDQTILPERTELTDAPLEERARWVEKLQNHYRSGETFIETMGGGFTAADLAELAYIQAKPSDYGPGFATLYHRVYKNGACDDGYQVRYDYMSGRNRCFKDYYEVFYIPPEHGLFEQNNILVTEAYSRPNAASEPGGPVTLHAAVRLTLGPDRKEPVDVRVQFLRRGEVLSTQHLLFDSNRTERQVSMNWQFPEQSEIITVRAEAVDPTFEETNLQDNEAQMIVKVALFGMNPEGSDEGMFEVDDPSHIPRSLLESFGGNPVFIQELIRSGGGGSTYASLSEEPVWEDSLSNPIGPKSFFAYDGSNMYLKMSSLASLSGAKVTSRFLGLEHQTGFEQVLTGSHEHCSTYADGTESCYTGYEYTVRHLLQSDASFYSQEMFEYDVEVTKAPEILSFYVDEQGNLHLSAEAYGYPGTTLKADLIFDFHANASQLPEPLRSLDHAGRPSGGYWRKHVYPEYESLEAPFIHPLTEADGVRLTRGETARLQGRSGGEAVIPQEKLLEMFQLSRQLDLFGKAEAYEAAAGAEKHELAKYVENGGGIQADTTVLDAAPRYLTLYVTDRFGRFDHMTIRYTPTAKHDGAGQPEFAYFQGKTFPSAASFVHQTEYGSQTIPVGYDQSIHMDLTIPDVVDGGKPGFLAAWSTDFESMKKGTALRIDLRDDEAVASRAVRLDLAHGLNQIGSDGSVPKSGAQIRQEDRVFRRFDPKDFSNVKLRVEETEKAGFAAFPRVLRAGQGVFVEGELEVRAILEGGTPSERKSRMADLIAGLFTRSGNKRFALYGKSDGTIIDRAKDDVGEVKYRDLDNNISGEERAPGGGVHEVELKGGAGGTLKQRIMNFMDEGTALTSSITIAEDSFGRKEAGRTEFHFKIPVHLKPAEGRFGGGNRNTKDLLFGDPSQPDRMDIRAFLVHPNVQDGLYTLRLEASADLSKISSDFAGEQLRLYSRLEPFLIRGTVFDDIWGDPLPQQPIVTPIPAPAPPGDGTGGGSENPGGGTDPGDPDGTGGDPGDEDWFWVE